jgi:hypothetical protein
LVICPESLLASRERSGWHKRHVNNRSVLELKRN